MSCFGPFSKHLGLPSYALKRLGVCMSTSICLQNFYRQRNFLSNAENQADMGAIIPLQRILKSLMVKRPKSEYSVRVLFI